MREVSLSLSLSPLTVHSCRSCSTAKLKISKTVPCAIPTPCAPHVVPIPLSVHVVHCRSAPIYWDYCENFQQNCQRELNSPCCCRPLCDWHWIHCVYYSSASDRSLLPFPLLQFRFRLHRACLAPYSIGLVSLAGSFARWRHCWTCCRKEEEKKETFN